MKIALTGARGRVGRIVAARARAQGHRVTGIDRVPADGPGDVVADVGDYDALVRAFDGCDGVIHLAAIPVPWRHPDHEVHNNNVTGSYNALRAAAEHGITRLSQASSVNAIGHAFSRDPAYDYFPIDEDHPTRAEDPYSLSKWICEEQASAFARRYGMGIVSLRFHFVTNDVAGLRDYYRSPTLDPRGHLFSRTGEQAAAEACLLGLTADYTGHHALFIIAPQTISDRPSRDIAADLYPGVPRRDGWTGHDSFFDSSRAGRVLGWHHDRMKDPA
jgi:UDP-glucose 4-epimerase